MGAFAVLCWDPQIELDAAAALAGLAPPADWTLALDAPGLRVMTRGPRAPRVRSIARGAGLVIGDVFPGGGPGQLRLRALEDYASADPEALAAYLAGGFWGRYVAILNPHHPHGPSVFRDPGGAVEALAWRYGPISVVASSLPEFLLSALPPRLSIDWIQVGSWLNAAVAIPGAGALIGITALAPGALHRPGAPPVQVWRPAEWVGAPAPAFEDAPRVLEACVDQVVAALAAERCSVLAEVSGGLDSAIVAAALQASSPPAPIQWMNYRAASGEGDERLFAQALAAHLGLVLTEAQKPEFALSAEALLAVSTGPRPGLSGLDVERDRDIGARAVEAGADSIFTGQGGDMAFFQTPTALIAADLARGGLASRWPGPRMVDTARWLRRSVWSLMHEARAANRRGAISALRSPPSFVLAEPQDLMSQHPWLDGLGEAPLGKQLHVLTLAEKQTQFGENRRGLVADVVHPLLSQPLLEFCLSLPTPCLTRGGRDRGLARTAFAGRLPEMIVARRTKGSLGGYYARVVAASLPMLRPWLLEGRLASQGLVDRSRLEAMMQPEQLVLAGDYPALLFTAMIEAWARAWEARIDGIAESRRG